MIPADQTNARRLYVSTHIGRLNYPSDPRQDQTDLKNSALGSCISASMQCLFDSL